VQSARLTAGHLDRNTAAPIAGGEQVHVGDVVATRRNDRTLTSSGEPVRNRETWTVAGIGADGSMTVTRERGHGTVTLPADYAHEHVRLGYAATEHGYHSDTVDHALALATPATTRRGLYVAATRGRDENLLCVVTGNDDVAEARDVLEGVLALDRADVAALTQRRTLSQEVRGHEPAPKESTGPRSVVPDWFARLRAATRSELDAAEQDMADSSQQRTRLAESVAAAERELARVEAATAPAREALAAATLWATLARFRHNDAQHRLDTFGIRGRRQVRRDVELAERLLGRANDQLQRTWQGTARHVDLYHQAQPVSTRRKPPYIDISSASDSRTGRTESPPYDGRSAPSTSGGGGPAVTPSVPANSTTSSNSSQALVVAANTPTNTGRSSKPCASGPTTPTSICALRRDSLGASSASAPNWVCDSGEFVNVPKGRHRVSGPWVHAAAAKDRRNRPLRWSQSDELGSGGTRCADDQLRGRTIARPCRRREQQGSSPGIRCSRRTPMRGSANVGTSTPTLRVH
jgi:hypothetical protein